MESGERNIDSFGINENDLIDDELDRVGGRARDQLKIALKNVGFCFREFPDSEEVMHRDDDGKIIGTGIKINKEIN